MLNDLGILTDSVRYFHEPNNFAKESLFYSSRSGIYHCNLEYQFSRQPSEIETCQIILVDEGKLYIHYLDEEKILCSGELAVTRLGVPPFYRADHKSTRFRWFHVEGHGAACYFRQIENINGWHFQIHRFPGTEQLIENLFDLLRQSAAPTQDISIIIHRILASLCRPFSHKQNPTEISIRNSAAYIEKNFADSELHIEDLASREALSVCYFLRQFRKYFEITPHQYLKNIRINEAKTMLDTTSKSVEDIAHECGFCSASHFISTFKENTGMTPRQFRSLWR